jgi:uncharacterized membrane protein YhaH (DUF805 family)
MCMIQIKIKENNMKHPFIIVLVITSILTLLNVWYMIRSKRLHDMCVKRRKQNKNK